MDWSVTLLDTMIEDEMRVNAFIKDEAEFRIQLLNQIKQQALVIEHLQQQLEDKQSEIDELSKKKEVELAREDVLAIKDELLSNNGVITD